MQDLNNVFLDTSGLIATVVIDDQWHSIAEPIWLDLICRKSKLSTTSLIINELFYHIEQRTGDQEQSGYTHAPSQPDSAGKC